MPKSRGKKASNGGALGARGQLSKAAMASLINNMNAPMPTLSLKDAPMPPTRTVKMRYAQKISLTSSAGAAHLAGSQYEFRLNSIYDPDLTSTGHQPWGSDQITAFYGRYRVDKVEIQVDCIPNPNTAHAVHALIQGPSGNMGLGGASLELLVENPRIKTQYCLPAAIQPPTMRWNLDIAEFLGIGRQAYQSDISMYSALVGANPTRTVYFNLATCVFAGTSETLQLMCTFVYHVKLWDPVNFSGS